MSKKHQFDSRILFKGTPAQGIWVLIAALIVSLLVHLGSLGGVARFGKLATGFNKPGQNKIKVKLVSRPKAPAPQKILETRQKETSPPEQARYKGQVDHKAEKETKLPARRVRPKAADPGQAGEQAVTRQSPRRSAQPKSRVVKSRRQILPGGDIPVQVRRKPRNAYEALIPDQSDLANEVSAGYQDYIEDKIAEGDKIDINTSQYRYIGYFSNMRKSIELAWSYPSAAIRRGYEGVVGLQFTIFKNGRVRNIKVVRSSGFRVLDNAIIEAIKLSSPFSPLPDGFGKKRLVITGNFRYVLNGYTGH